MWFCDYLCRCRSSDTAALGDQRRPGELARRRDARIRDHQVGLRCLWTDYHRLARQAGFLPLTLIRSGGAIGSAASLLSFPFRRRWGFGLCPGRKEPFGHTSRLEPQRWGRVTRRAVAQRRSRASGLTRPNTAAIRGFRLGFVVGPLARFAVVAVLKDDDSYGAHSGCMPE